MGRIDAVFFDVYNTLLENETDEERQETYAFLSLWLSYRGVHIDPVRLRSLYLNLCRKEISKSAASYPDIDIGKVFFAILSDHGRYAPPPAAVAEMALLFRMWTTYHLSPFPGVVPMLEALKGKTRLGIVSNAQRLFTIPELTRFGMPKYFEVVVLSSDLGISKPSPEIFAAGLRALAVEPQRAVYVGDSLVNDIYGGGKVGMKTIWINRGGQVSEVPEIKPDFEVSDESALRELLLSLI